MRIDNACLNMTRAFDLNKDPVQPVPSEYQLEEPGGH